jgi:hypothetical protein
MLDSAEGWFYPYLMTVKHPISAIMDDSLVTVFNVYLARTGQDKGKYVGELLRRDMEMRGELYVKPADKDSVEVKP